MDWRIFKGSKTHPNFNAMACEWQWMWHQPQLETSLWRPAPLACRLAAQKNRLIPVSRRSNVAFLVRMPRRLSVPLFLLVVAAAVSAGEMPQRLFEARTESAFQLAQIQFQSQSNNPVAAWQFGRACFDLADVSTNKSARAGIARKGMAACRHSLALANSAAGHYYLAFNMGQLARTERIGALKLVREMERELKAAAELDRNFDFGGPERSLGLLYREAPDWPVSLGSRRKARQFLESAVALAPDYPENVLYAAESHLKWREYPEAARELEALDVLWPRARTNLTGELWESSWNDWTNRRDGLRKRLNR